jgi:hypothetical protein
MPFTLRGRPSFSSFGIAAVPPAVASMKRRGFRLLTRRSNLAGILYKRRSANNLMRRRAPWKPGKYPPRWRIIEGLPNMPDRPDLTGWNCTPPTAISSTNSSSQRPTTGPTATGEVWRIASGFWRKSLSRFKLLGRRGASAFTCPRTAFSTIWVRRIFGRPFFMRPTV